jgi:enoyl-[acyl-carrier protein] reductase I
MNLPLFSNKRGIIMGVANSRSIATGIARYLHAQGAELAFSFLPDETGKSEKRVNQAVAELNPLLVAPCNVNSDQDLDGFFQQAKDACKSIDFLVHSIAFAPLEDIRRSTLHSSRQGFLTSMETSVYSFIASAKRASEMMNQGGSVLTLSYFGGEKVVQGYNLMGVSKAALECAVKYLAFDLGPKNIRVNAISAGPIKTLAASAVGDFGNMLGLNSAVAPLKKNVSTDEVGKSSAYLLSDLSSGTTGEILHVDAGYNIMGGPGRALDLWNIKPRNFK